MPFFWKPYQSEVTRFIDELKSKKPSLEAEQRAGRALLWDRAIDHLRRGGSGFGFGRKAGSRDHEIGAVDSPGRRPR